MSLPESRFFFLLPAKNNPLINDLILPCLSVTASRTLLTVPYLLAPTRPHTSRWLLDWVKIGLFDSGESLR